MIRKISYCRDSLAPTSWPSFRSINTPLTTALMKNYVGLLPLAANLTNKQPLNYLVKEVGGTLFIVAVSIVFNISDSA